MRKTLLILSISVFFLSLMFFSGCKEKSTETAETITSAQDHATTENEFASVFEYVNTEGTSNTKINGIAEKGNSQEINALDELLPTCATTTFDTATRTLVINFGNTDCLCRDGIYRRGKIIAQFNGLYGKVGAKVVVTLQDYYANFKNYQGTKTIERIDTYKWNITVTNAKVVTDSSTISWNSNWTIEKIAGTGTLTIWDDEYQYTGSANGINRNGIKFTVNIDSPLKRKIQLGCFTNFIAGILTIQNEDGVTMVLNYDPIGGEPCDKIADVTINGKTNRITLR